MTFEERIDRLTERHEALAQTVEMHNAMLLRLETTQDAMQRDQSVQNQHQREMMATLMDAVNKLTRAVDQHETRMRKLENGA